MPISKSAVAVLASTSVPPGTTRTSPVAGSAVDCRAHYGGLLTYAIANGASAPGVAVSLTFQVSSDGATWRDLWTVGGDIVANSQNSGSIDLPRAAMYLRPIAYGNTTNAVTVAAELQAVTGL